MLFKVQIDNFDFTYCLEGDFRHSPILFLHGFMGDRDEFKQAIATLSNQFYCVTIDLPAHGQTNVITDVNDEFIEQNIDQNIDQNYYYTIQSTANSVIKFLDYLRVDHCFLVGYSMGGRLALYLALHFPRYFYKVILESASAGLQTATERSDRLAKDQKLAAELENGDFQLFLENWYQQLIFANLRSHPNFPHLLEQRLKNSPVKLAKSLRNLSTGMQPSLWERLSENQIPLLLLVGELDVKFVKTNRQMEQICKFSQLEIISSCGHNIHFENPDSFTEKIQVFLHK